MNEDPEVQKLLADVVLYKVDAEKDAGVDLAKEHHVSGYPTFLMVNDELKPIDRWMGYTKPYLGTKMGRALSDLSTIEEKELSFGAKPTADMAVRLADYNGAAGDYAMAVTYYRKAEKLDPATPQGAEIFDATYSGYRKDVFTQDDVLQAAETALQRTDAGGTLDVCERMAFLGKQTEDKHLQAKFLRAAIDRTADATDAEIVKRRESMMPDYALYVENDGAKAVKLKRASMPEGWMEDAGQLNSYAWWAFESGVDTKGALALARKGADLAAPGKEKAMILDTAAELCNALNDCHEAVALTKQAMAEDPESEYYKKQLDRFQDLLATQK
ncbi:MAG: hypothetical protein KC729_01085 [Candidatus Eisenbacteria bacterium]|uniref:Thioredoxin family protein n=1 Tax=Eiseniibacteriota bacterium TaxID=2212470 RepID=A0A956LXB1_UNCEI|nr:hypothetical protein [Candidatus Eisenbacteria bacterium]